MEEIWQCQSPNLPLRCFDFFDQYKRQRDGSRHWDAMEPILMKAFAHKGARDFEDGCWLRLIHEGNT